MAEQPPQCPLEGELQEWKPGLFQVSRFDEAKRRVVGLWNNTSDTQFKATYQFVPLGDDPIEALGDTVAEAGHKYTASLYPGDAKWVIAGKWSSQKRSLGSGRPDKEWQQQQAKRFTVVVDEEQQRVEALFKKLGLDLKNTPADEAGRICVKNGVRYVDHEFPPVFSSLCKSWEFQLPNYGWARPNAWCGKKKPALFVGEIEPNDIDQGMLGDCYLMCALACISEFPHLVQAAFRAVQRPTHGFWRCMLCKTGMWQTVVVDDFLPVNPVTGLPAFAKNREEPDELWVSVLEKAYAKLHGSYAAIKAGDPAFAIADVLGAPYEKLRNRPEYDEPDALFDFLMRCDELDHIMALGTPGQDPTHGGQATDLSEKYKAVGLCTGHAFSLIRVKKSHGHKLCMIRNPWGNDLEWNGDWSDDSPLWTDAIKKDVGFYKGDDGTFWMCWEDVLKWFTAGSVTYVLPDWSQLRVPTSFDDTGVPNAALKVTTKSAVRCWFGAHQRDTRGLRKDDPANEFVGFLLTVVQEDDSGAVNLIATHTKDVKWQPMRDVFVEVELKPSSKPYFIIAQSYQSTSRDFTLSMFCERDEGVAVSIVRFADDAAKKRHYPPSTIPVSKLTQPVAGQPHQILTKRWQLPLNAKAAGGNVDWNQQPTAADRELAMLIDKTGQAIKASDSEAVAPPAPAPVPEAAASTGTKAAAVPQAPAKAAPAAAKKKDDPNVIVQRSDATAPRVGEGWVKAEPCGRDTVLTGPLEKYSTGRNTGMLTKLLKPSALNWKKRHFILHGDGALRYFEDESAAKEQGTVPLSKARVRLVASPTKDDHNAVESDKPDMVLVVAESPPGAGNGYELLLRAATDEDRADWVKAFRRYCA